MRESAEQYPGRTIGRFFVSLLLAWVFVGTIDGPVVNFHIDSGPSLFKTLKLPNSERAIPIALQWIGVTIGEPPPIDVSFLLFDFKQNLRHWPNVSGDISRSPPFSFDRIFPGL